MNRNKESLLQFNTSTYLLILISFAIVFSLILTLLQSYWYTGIFFDSNIFIIDFITSLIAASFITLISTFFIKYLNSSVLTMQEKNIEMDNKLKAQNDFFASMSHEIRTPMNAIIGMSQILMDDNDLSKRQTQAIVTINNSSKILLEIINDILDFSKIEAGKLSLESTPFELEVILNYLADMTGLQIQEKGLELVFDIDHNVEKKFYGDPLRVSQILLNLISNSIKFTETGTITLCIKTLNSTQESSFIQFEVKDTGIGIEKDKIPTLFQNYSQAGHDTSRKYGGTGLGLSIAKKLTSMMDGSIWAESEYGKGTSFFINIRLQKDLIDTRRKYRFPSAELMKKKVLIIEPREESTAALKNMLNYFHISVTAAISLEDAQKYLKNQKFDILFIDNELYNQNGINDKELQAITKKVLIEDWMDSFKKNDTRDNAKHIYLRRPFNQQMLFEIILTLHGYSSEHHEVKKSSSYSKEDLVKLGHHQILVAEDNKINQKVIEGLLLETNIKAICVDNGQKLIKELYSSSYEYKVILMDINMPILNGYEATCKIREDNKYNNIKIIALSGDNSDEDIEKSIGSGMQHHLAKPIDVKEFYKVLSTSLK